MKKELPEYNIDNYRKDYIKAVEAEINTGKTQAEKDSIRKEYLDVDLKEIQKTIGTSDHKEIRNVLRENYTHNKLLDEIKNKSMHLESEYADANYRKNLIKAIDIENDSKKSKEEKDIIWNEYLRENSDIKNISREEYIGNLLAEEREENVPLPSKINLNKKILSINEMEEGDYDKISRSFEEMDPVDFDKIISSNPDSVLKLLLVLERIILIK